MFQRLTATVLIAVMPFGWNVVAGSDDVQRTTSVLAAIFGEDIYAESARSVHRRAMQLVAEERFLFLQHHVLPVHMTAPRIDIDFLPLDVSSTTNPEAAQQREFLKADSQLIAPAIQLVEVALLLDRLDELKRAADRFTPTNDEQRKAAAAFRFLLLFAEQDFAAARESLVELFDLARSPSVTKAERGPEAVAAWVALRDSETAETGRDLAFLIYEHARNSNGPRSERWHRHLYSLKHELDRIDQSASDRIPRDGQQRPSNWSQVSRVTAHTHGRSYPRATWTVEPGKTHHVTAHDHDYLYYAIPLTGDFAVEADISTFGYKDIHFGYGGVWAGPGYDLKSCLVGNVREDFASRPIEPPLTRVFDWMRARLVVQNGVRRSYINGRLLFEGPAPADAPWFSIHSPWYTSGAVKNLRVTGTPAIPQEIELATSPDLPGWLAYYGGIVGQPSGDWELVRAEDSVELAGRHHAALAGTFHESLLRYHRPMLEDGTIEYEFFYSTASETPSHVHPALGRVAMLLLPDGVAAHQITDGQFDNEGAGPESKTSDSVGESSLPLRENEWNKLRLRLTGDRLSLQLNDQPIASRDLADTDDRTFGLFHYADQTTARVRNIRWRGDWPKTIPPPAEQQLADDTLDQLLPGPSALPVAFEHNFSDGLPRGQFAVIGEGWQEHFEQLGNGVRLTRPEGHYANFGISPQVTVQGDFDITAAFEDLQVSAVEGGESNIQLLVTLDDELAHQVRVYRKCYGFSDRSDEQLCQAAIFSQRDGKTNYEFPASPAQESTSGRMRLVRRGADIYFLYAEDDSPEFQLIHQQTVSDAPSAVAGIRLVVEQHKAGSASVVWKSLTVKAAAGTTPDKVKELSLQELNQQRDALQANQRFDFTKTAKLDDFAIWGGNFGKYTPSPSGLKIEAPGTEEWAAAGVAPKLALQGDFDATLELDVLRLEPCEKNQESTVFIQTEFADDAGTAVETKYSITSTGFRAAETQIRKRTAGGGFAFQELQSKQSANAALLRVCRRGESAYFIFQEAPDKPPEILGSVKVGRTPIPKGFLRILVHTGGANRSTIVQLKSLTLHAERIY